MKVLIGVDESRESRDAVKTSFELFGPNAEYTIANIAGRFGTGVLFNVGYAPTGQLSAKYLTEQFAAAEETARGAAELVPGGDVEIDAELGDAGVELCRLAEEQTSDVVVIGSQDKSVWQRLLDPSVGRYLIDHAPCPVLVVR